MPNYGTSSKQTIAQCHPDLRTIAGELILSVNVSAKNAKRTIPEQIVNIRNKVSKTLDSRHIPRDEEGNYAPSAPSNAIHFLPYIDRNYNPWPQRADPILVTQKKIGMFFRVAGAVGAISEALGIDIRWGGDWDGDGNPFDQKFDDYGHYERRIAIPPLIVPAGLLREANEALRARGLKEYTNP